MPLLEEWRGDGGAAYRALADRLRLLVLDGRLPVGTVLPSERALAEALDTSRTTTTGAYRLLRADGFAAGSQGAGTWTTLPAPDPAGTSAAGWALSPYPGTMDGDAGSSDGRGDFSTAATEAPPQLHAAYVDALTELPRFLPGNGYLTQGLPALRARIAERYTARGLATSPEEILITNGALQALRLVLTVVSQRGDRVLFEHPTYPAAVDSVRRAGGRPVALPIEGGWDVARTRTVLRQTGVRLAYLMVDFQNPTGLLLDHAGRVALARALADAGCVAIIDETNVDLDLRALLVPTTTRSTEAPARRFDTPPPMAAVTAPGGAICLGSASKSVWGGLRIGWIRAERSSIRRMALARDADDLAGPVLEQLAAERLMGDLDTIVHDRREELAERCGTLVKALAVHLPQWQVPLPDGGLSVWCHLPEPRSSAVTAAARDLGLRVTAGPRFGIDGAFESRMRLPFARPSHHLEGAVRLLAQAWHCASGTAETYDETPVV